MKTRTIIKHRKENNTAIQKRFLIIYLHTSANGQLADIETSGNSTLHIYNIHMYFGVFYSCVKFLTI